MGQKVYRGHMDLKADGQAGEFKAVFATLNVVDADGDVTVPGAFTKGQRVLLSAYGHKADELPVGMGQIREEGNQAIVEGRFFLDTATGKEHYTTIKNLGDMQEYSYGFEVQQGEPGQFDGKPVRYLKKLSVFEVAPVQRGAGVDTRTLDIKAKAVMRSEADGDHPAGHYLIVEDPKTTTTWHLRVRDVDGKLDHRLMGAAWAALHGGYRGNRYEGPGKQDAIRSLTALYEEEGMEVPKEGKGGLKSVNLGKQMAEIRDAFDKEFNPAMRDAEQNWDEVAWVREIYDDHLIVDWKKGVYSVNYALDDTGRYVFTPRGEWVEGAFVFMAGAKVAPPKAEYKVGRVLARRNAERLVAALQTLNDILKDAGLLGEHSAGDDEDEDNDEAGNHRKSKDLKSGTLAARVAIEILESDGGAG